MMVGVWPRPMEWWTTGSNRVCTRPDSSWCHTAVGFATRDVSPAAIPTPLSAYVIVDRE
jgi:hypothetical protein